MTAKSFLGVGFSQPSYKPAMNWFKSVDMCFMREDGCSTKEKFPSQKTDANVCTSSIFNRFVVDENKKKVMDGNNEKKDITNIDNRNTSRLKGWRLFLFKSDQNYSLIWSAFFHPARPFFDFYSHLIFSARFQSWNIPLCVILT